MAKKEIEKIEKEFAVLVSDVENGWLSIRDTLYKIENFLVNVKPEHVVDALLHGLIPKEGD